LPLGTIRWEAVDGAGEAAGGECPWRPVQRACQGLPIQLDDCSMCASDRAHREAGDGAVLLSRESPL